MPRSHSVLIVAALSFVTLCFTGCTKSGDKSSSKTGSGKSDSKTNSSKTDSSKTQSAKTQTSPKTKTQIVVTIELVSPKGLKEAIAKHKGKAVLVDYWATWCPPCKKSFPHTVGLGKKHAKEGLVVIAVCMDAIEFKQAAIKFLKSQNADIINLGSTLGYEGDAFQAYEIPGGLPHYKIFDREGKLIDKVGGGEQEKIDAAVLKALGK